MKKYYLLIGVGIILILIGIFLSLINRNDIINDGNNKWIVIYDEIEKTNYNKFSNKLSAIDTFHSAFENNNKYSYMIPQGVTIESKNIYNTIYSGDNLKIYYSTDNTINFDDRLKSLYDAYKNEKYDVTILKNKTYLTNTLIPILIKLYNSDKDEYQERLLIYYNDNEDFYYVLNYEIVNYQFSDQFITDVIENFKVESGLANRINCEKKNDKYSCAYDDIAIDFNINSSKYINYAMYSVNNYGSYFSIVDNGEIVGIQIMLSYSKSDIHSYIEDSYTKDDVYKETNINGIKVYQSIQEDTNLSKNIVYFNNNYAMVIEINSLKNANNFLNDFLKFEVK